MAKNFGVECFPRNYCVTFTLCAVIVVLAISCIPQSVHGNHVPQPGSRNANPTRGRNIRPEVRTTPQRRRGSPQQQAPSRAASSSRRFSVQQNARAATQQRASASRRTNQRGEPSSRTRQVGIRGTIRGVNVLSSEYIQLKLIYGNNPGFIFSECPTVTRMNMHIFTGFIKEKLGRL